MASLIHFTDDNFENEVEKASGLVVVDFWATWCGPCLMLGPVIEELAEENASKVKIGKLSVEENELTAKKYGVMSIPSVIFFKDGKVIETLIGVRSKNEYQDIIDKESK